MNKQTQLLNQTEIRMKKFVATTMALIIIAFVVVTPLTTLTAQAASASYDDTAAFDVLDIVNAERAENGLEALTMDAELMATAKLRAEEIVSQFSHTRPDGTSCFTAFPASQTTAGENIAAGQTTASWVMNSWMNSSGHRANILSARYKAIGVACYYVPGSLYGYYWVQCFGGTVNQGITRGNMSTTAVTTTDGTIPMYRMYNPNSGEHFYTASYNEALSLGSVGWSYEGVAWYAPTSGQEVYRLYNTNAGDHHYTMSAGERDYLVSVGWSYEGVAWYSGGSVPLYRAYNPNAQTGSHHYTSNFNEIWSICCAGWSYEDIAWYGVR